MKKKVKGSGKKQRKIGEIHSTIYGTSAKLCEMVIMSCLFEMVDLRTTKSCTSRKNYRSEASLSQFSKKPKSKPTSDS